MRKIMQNCNYRGGGGKTYPPKTSHEPLSV